MMLLFSLTNAAAPKAAHSITTPARMVRFLPNLDATMPTGR